MGYKRWPLCSAICLFFSVSSSVLQAQHYWIPEVEGILFVGDAGQDSGSSKHFLVHDKAIWSFSAGFSYRRQLKKSDFSLGLALRRIPLYSLQIEFVSITGTMISDVQRDFSFLPAANLELARRFEVGNSFLRFGVGCTLDFILPGSFDLTLTTIDSQGSAYHNYFLSGAKAGSVIHPELKFNLSVLIPWIDDSMFEVGLRSRISTNPFFQGHQTISDPGEDPIMLPYEFLGHSISLYFGALFPRGKS